MSRSTISTFQLFALFPDEESARQYLEDRLWSNGPVCPDCKSGERVSALGTCATRKPGFYRCLACAFDFTIRTNTIFERSKVPLHKWLYSMYLLVTARKGISSLQLGKEIGVTQKTAWFILGRLREACGGPDGVTCPKCGSADVLFLEKYNRWHCRAKHASPQFTLKTGTIMEDSPIGLDKWLTAMWQIVNCKNGISSCEIARAIGVTQKSAWFMDHRIRLMLGEESPEKLSGHVEADETFIGGKARNMHVAKRARRITGTGGKDKTAVMGILERGGKVRTKVIPNRKKSALQSEVRKHVEAGSALYTDALLSYEGLAGEYAHQVVDHAVAYVDGKVHTNGLENFWSLLKRGISGTYVSVEPFHLFRYLDEQAYRFNNRKMTDAERFSAAVVGMVGKRLTFDQLTGKQPVPGTCIN